jgi:SpoVK/Ycf46/Vps4 family AAA+-type ATPase
MTGKKIISTKRKTNAKKKIIAKGIIHSISVRPKTTARRRTIRGKTIRSDTLTNRRGIYFSNNLSSLKDMVKVKSYFKKQNQKGIKKDKPLYIFDLSRVSSKYIGETEKNLGRIFQRVKKMDGILFFDEADALFGKRSKVSDAHDKYANLETNYLVKRLQKYKVVMFITSNLKKPITKQSIDKLDYIICLPIKKTRVIHR